MGNRSKYDASFRKNAIELVLSGRRAADVARDLDLHVETLYQWVKQYKRSAATAAVTGQGSEESLAAGQNMLVELERLRRENERLRLEQDILKKAMGIVTASVPPISRGSR